VCAPDTQVQTSAMSTAVLGGEIFAIRHQRSARRRREASAHRPGVGSEIGDDRKTYHMHGEVDDRYLS
jgi:hypothetical protein